MDLFDVLKMLGGLCLFLFGMNVMGQALERRAGGQLQSLLSRLTSNRLVGLLTGLAITAVIQSSSATTVMVVGFVNSRLMSLRQAINVIMGANIGTTVTAWILSLGGIDGDAWFIKLLKPTSFTPILALIGIIFYMFCKSDKKKDTGTILLGFATLMFGMDTMSKAVSGLADVPEFQQLFLLFENPIFGVLAGAILTAIIQSSSASVGVLQALAGSTGQVTYGAAIPIIMGQNIGTCITAILSSFGTNRNAKRAAMVHLSFNVIGTLVWLMVFWLVDLIFSPALLGQAVSEAGIAVAHSIFNILCTLLLLPLSGVLEKLAYRLVPDAKEPETAPALDDRLLATPSVALERCRIMAASMADTAMAAIKGGIESLQTYSDELASKVRELEERSDHYEDVLGTFLVKLSSHQISERDSAEATKLLKLIGDFERISDHAVDLLESAEEMQKKSITFTPAAIHELQTISGAVSEILDLSLLAFHEDDVNVALRVEPLEQVIDQLKEQLRTNHIRRLQQGECSIEAGFVWSDLLTGIERTSDHCSNIAGCIIDLSHHNMNLHESLRELRNTSEDFRREFSNYSAKYAL